MVWQHTTIKEEMPDLAEIPMQVRIMSLE